MKGLRVTKVVKEKNVSSDNHSQIFEINSSFNVKSRRAGKV